jgi:hypothetical protein
MSQQQYYSPQPPPQQSSSGCGRLFLIFGGCLAVFVIGAVGLILAAGIFWDRGSEAGRDWAIGWIIDRSTSDVADPIPDARPATSDVTLTRRIETRQEYLDTLEMYNRQFADAMEGAGRLLSNPQLNDEQWKSDVAAQIAQIRRIEGEARAIDPPEEMAQVHEHWVDSLSEFNRAMDSLADGLDTLNPAQLFVAIDAMERATRSYESMLHELEALEE